MSHNGEEKVIGIDLGTTNSCLAVFDHQQATVINNAEGERTTPSVVSFSKTGERIVGSSARRQAVLHPDRTVSSIKRLIGRKREEVTDQLNTMPYQTAAGDADAVRIEIDQRHLSPEEISAMVLDKLKNDAEAFVGQPITKAVITVPAYFNEAQRQATKAAANIAGLEVLRLINEPTAAALAYGFTEDRDEVLLVFDLGGGTFDVSVLEVGDGVFEVLATSGDNHLGGDDFDQAIVNHLAEKFQAEQGVDLRLDPAALQRLYEAAEKSKIELSTMPQSHILLPFISVSASNQPLNMDVTLTRAELNEIVQPLLQRIVAPLERAIGDSGMSKEQIDHVLLVGGMTRMPAVVEQVQQLIGISPHKGVNPDEAVAVGAAIQAGIISGQVHDVLLLDVLPMPLGIETKGGVMTQLIDANTTIPVRATETFTTAEDNQLSVEVHILQGEREFAADNRSLGRVQLLGIPPAQASEPQIEVTFDIDANGILDVTARDLGTGNRTETRIESTTSLSGEEIERMRQEAMDNRVEDMRRRHVVEVRNEAAITCQQAEAALQRNGDKMTEQERQSVQRFLQQLQQVINEQEGVDVIEQLREQLVEAIQVFARRLYEDDRAPHQSNEAISAAIGPALVGENDGVMDNFDVEDAVEDAQE